MQSIGYLKYTELKIYLNEAEKIIFLLKQEQTKVAETHIENARKHLNQISKKHQLYDDCWILLDEIEHYIYLRAGYRATVKELIDRYNEISYQLNKKNV